MAGATHMLVIREHNHHMARHQTSTQQRRAYTGSFRLRRMPASISRPLDGRGGTVSGSGSAVASNWGVSAPRIVNETKMGIVGVIQVLGRVTTSHELWLIWGGSKSQAAFDYHLSTLVRAGVLELLTDGRELGLRLVEGRSPPRQIDLPEAIAVAAEAAKRIKL